jgi:hypothetical protein
VITWAIPPRIAAGDLGRANLPGLKRVSAQSQDDHKFDCEREH